MPSTSNVVDNIKKMEAARAERRRQYEEQKQAKLDKDAQNKALGRNVDEMLRMVDALDFHEKHGEVCPAGWQEGQAGMTPSAEGVASYLSENASGL